MNNAVSFIPLGMAICYCYLTLRESNKIDINPWYELNSLESLAIIYCIIIASVRANWFFFVSTLKLGIIVFLVILGWYLLYNLEDLKNMIAIILIQNSLPGENYYEIDFENPLNENYVSDTLNSPEEEVSDHETADLETQNEINNNLDIMIPQIDNIIENFNADAKKYIEYVELKEEKETAEISNPVHHQLSSEQLVSELERITDSLVRDTRKIADNVSLVSSMIVENSISESSKILENKNSKSITKSEISKTSIKTENIEINSEKMIPETEDDIVTDPRCMNERSEYQENEIEEAVQIICDTEDIAEKMVSTIANFIETSM